MIESAGTSLIFGTISPDKSNPLIPENADILSVEYKIMGENEWVDIRSVMRYDPFIPAIAQTFRAFTTMGTTYFAHIEFTSGEVNTLFNYVMNYQIDKIRVTYAENQVA